MRFASSITHDRLTVFSSYMIHANFLVSTNSRQLYGVSFVLHHLIHRSSSPSNRDFKLTTVTVTGGAGFIGSHLVNALINEGHRVSIIDSLTDYYSPDIKLANLASIDSLDRATLSTQDLAESNPQAVFAGSEVVFHLAGRPGVRASFSDFGNYVHDNLTATARVIEGCLAAGVKRLVIASSSSVYGTAPVPFHESTPPSPISPYGRTKLLSEQMALSAVDSGLEVMALRYFTVFGPRQRPDMAINRIIRAAIEGSEFRIFGDGTQTRDFTFVSDIVHATITAGLKTAYSGVCNIGGETEISLNGVLDLVETHTGRKIRRRYVEAEMGDPKDTRADLKRAQSVLEYRPVVDFESGLKSEIDWMVKQNG